MINEQMVTRNGQKGFLDDKGNFYPIADMPADDAKVTPSNTADQSGGLGAPDVQPRTSANANRDGSRPGGGMTDAQIKAAQDKANAERAALQQRNSSTKVDTGSFFDGAKGGKYDQTPAPTPPAPAPKPNPNVVVSPKTGEKTKFERRLPTTAELKAAQAARKSALASGASKGEAEYQAVKAGVGVSKPAPTAAVTGGVNPRAGSYAAYQNNLLKQLGSDYGRLPQNTIKPVAKRTMKQEAYDLVLDYLLSEGHVDTVEEAHYVMLQMTSEHVQQVVEERTAADPKMKARMGHSNPAINGKPVPYPKGHPEEGKPMSFNKAETDGVNMYRKASEKVGRKIYADEPLPKK